ncbi:MAG: transcription elongation factor GreA [Candidatus Yanofskybacteria bacterium CG10_big_fil_rev_8_21_14_0_10_36_16]|uniref:Transcription elongation factor GreA n=1 Tax=Candidatus Yanofskybacteria bacterium CG10_big_fil_rev_8_21_14_0_10_36_16 TaxID=1975096 RepID=A0A2J0Q6V9_9BACT|nr:MAG: transcription elongation factor GreA [Candidatus Yanofskybacteria bacterium CG10_big_fil_rev_8_21_14_0_10_36_16]
MTTYLSPEGLEKINKELEERKTTVRDEINEKIRAAKELGDLSENSEYTEAKENQSFNEGRIEEIEAMLKDFEIIQNGKNKSAEIGVGATVLASSSYGEKEFTIVGTAEADPTKGFISNESPLGRAFLGHKKGEEVEVSTPVGLMKYKIKKIS